MRYVVRPNRASLDEIRSCALTLTNPEKAGVLSVISGVVPPTHEIAAEYLRAFAHVEDEATIRKLFDALPRYQDVIHLGDVERFYQLYGGVSATRSGAWGYLDEEEREWIRAFNERHFNKKMKEAKRE